MNPPGRSVAKPLIVVALLLFLVGLHYTAFKSTAGLDFEHYYVGAKMVAAGQGTSLHDANAQFEWQAKLLNGVSTPFNYPAPMALLYLPATLFGLSGGYLVWTLLSTAMIVASVILLNREFRFAVDTWFLVLLCAGYLPVHATLASGQCDSFLLLTYASSLVLLSRGRSAESGLVLSLALLKFHLVLPFAFLMLLRRQWRFLMGFAAGAVVLLGIWLSISGPGLFRSYPKLVMGIKYLQRGPFEPLLMSNFRGVFYRLSGHEAPLWLLVVVALVGLSIVAVRWRSLESGFAAAMTMMMLTSYHGYVYDLILLLIPLMVASRTVKGWNVPQYVIYGLLAIPVVPYLLVTKRSVWLLTIPIAVLCWLLVSKSGDAVERVQGTDAGHQRLTPA